MAVVPVMSRPLLVLNRDEVHVWFLNPEGFSSDDKVRAAIVLSDDEYSRGSRLCSPARQSLYVATRVLVRTTLSRYADVDPRAWRFGLGVHGKPFVLQPSGAPAYHFNASNTAGLVACVIARQPNVGIDVEDLARPRDLERLASAFFARTEVADLQRHAGTMRRERFFAYWTLKESYVKARGEGLAVPLDTFAFELDATATGAKLAFDRQNQGAARCWQFGCLRPTARHTIAIAVRAHTQRMPEVLMRDAADWFEIARQNQRVSGTWGARGAADAPNACSTSLA